jgi:hypothetical protein
MKFELPVSLNDLGAYLPRLIDLAGRERWAKRVRQLEREGSRSLFQAKIVTDHHWLEMELAVLMDLQSTHGRLPPEQIGPQSMAALRFAGTVVEAHARITPTGRKSLEGRLRDSLNSTFPSFFLEMEIALRLFEEGFEVEFPDIEGTGLVDLFFRKDAVEGEVECKSLSADAGRKIHRKDFYRFVDAIRSTIEAHASSRSRSILLVTLRDRLPTDDISQNTLRAAALRVLKAPERRGEHGPFFSVEREAFEQRLDPTFLQDHATFARRQSEFYTACQKAFGDACHVTGGMGPDGACFVVMRSEREDDHSKPTLEAIKKAATQLSSSRPGFVAVQYEDIEARDLTLPHLRRRSALLANNVFHSSHGAHVAGVYYCAYAGLQVDQNRLATPAFVCINPKLKFSLDGLPFRLGIRNSEFAQALGVDPAHTDPDDFKYGTTL